MVNWDEGGVPRRMKLAELDLDWLNPVVEPYRGKLAAVVGA